MAGAGGIGWGFFDLAVCVDSGGAVATTLAEGVASGSANANVVAWGVAVVETAGGVGGALWASMVTGAPVH